MPDRSSGIALAKVGHSLRSLNETIDSDCSIDWIPLDSPAGRLARQATLILILTRAAAERAPGRRLVVDHSIGRGRGLYCELKPAPLFPAWTVRRIRNRMAEIIRNSESVEPAVLTDAELDAFLERRGETDAWQPGPGSGPAVLYRSGGVTEYLGMPLLHSTSAVGVFDLVPWKQGMVLRFPDGEGREPLPPLRSGPQAVPGVSGIRGMGGHSGGRDGPRPEPDRGGRRHAGSHQDRGKPARERRSPSWPTASTAAANGSYSSRAPPLRARPRSPSG